VKRPAGINGKLISFAISNGAANAKDLPSRLKILSWGENTTIKGPVRVGKKTLECLASNQKKLAFEQIALDYNHQTLPGSPTYQKDPVQVAAYGSLEVIDGDGVYMPIDHWTPSGKEHAPNYVDLSPVVQLDENGEVIFIHSVALCRQGCTEGLSFYSADFSNPSSLRSHSSSNKPMDYRTAVITLLKTLGVTLPDNPSDAEIGDAVTAYKADDQGGEGLSSSEVEAKIAEALKPLASRFEEGDRVAVVTKATAAGKVIPLTDEEIKTMPLATLASLVEKLPVTVPLAERGVKFNTDKSKLTALSAEQKVICKNLGLSEEKYLKSLAAEVEAKSAVVAI
jgi:phage I-like protein